MHGLKRAEAAGNPVPPLLDCLPWLMIFDFPYPGTTDVQERLSAVAFLFGDHLSEP